MFEHSVIESQEISNRSLLDALFLFFSHQLNQFHNKESVVDSLDAIVMFCENRARAKIMSNEIGAPAKRLLNCGLYLCFTSSSVAARPKQVFSPLFSLFFSFCSNNETLRGFLVLSLPIRGNETIESESTDELPERIPAGGEISIKFIHLNACSGGVGIRHGFVVAGRHVLGGNGCPVLWVMFHFKKAVRYC